MIDLQDAAALQALRREHGSWRNAEAATGIDRAKLSRAWRKLDLPPIGKDGLTADERGERLSTGIEFGSDEDGATATLTARGNVREVAVGDVEGLLAERGLSIDEWQIVNLVVNEWDGPVVGGGTQKLRQLKAHLRPKRILASAIRPAALPALDDLPTARPFAPASGDLGILTGCWQYPYHDATFEALFEQFLADVKPAWGIDHGDGMDFATISRHPDDPATSDPAQASIDGYGLALYRRRKASPDTSWRILLGNHDVRMLTEQLARSERLAGVRPAVWPGEEPSEPLNSPRRALRTDELGVEVVMPPHGSAKYAAAEIVVSPRYIAVHGVKSDAGSAARATVQKYGCSISMAHTHRQRLFSVRLERGPLDAHDATGVEVGCGMEIGGRGSLYATRPDWANGAYTATLDEDGEPFFEPIRYRSGVLRWRGFEWRA